MNWDNHKVAKEWATHTKGESFCGNSSHGTYSFRGYDLFSYSTLVGCRYPTQEIALLTTKDYSVTTAHHLGMAHAACYMAKLLCLNVPHFLLPGERENRAFAHRDNLKYFLDQYGNTLSKISKARASREISEWEQECVERTLGQAQGYVKAFGLEWGVGIPEMPDTAQDLEKALDAHRAKQEHYNSPREVERRVRAEGRRMLRELVDEG